MREQSKLSGAIVAAVDQALWLLHMRVLSKMLLVTKDGEPIPGTQKRFQVQMFGWSDDVDAIFNPKVKQPHHNAAAKAAFEKERWRVLDSMAERGLAVRMSSAHHHAPSQLSTRLRRAPPRPTRPFPIDIFFGIAVVGAMIGFE